MWSQPHISRSLLDLRTGAMEKHHGHAPVCFEGQASFLVPPCPGRCPLPQEEPGMTGALLIVLTPASFQRTEEGLAWLSTHWPSGQRSASVAGPSGQPRRRHTGGPSGPWAGAPFSLQPGGRVALLLGTSCRLAKVGTIWRSRGKPEQACGLSPLGKRCETQFLSEEEHFPL